jgi:hypothetical protein
VDCGPLQGDDERGKLFIPAPVLRWQACWWYTVVPTDSICVRGLTLGRCRKGCVPFGTISYHGSVVR